MYFSGSDMFATWIGLRALLLNAQLTKAREMSPEIS